MHIYIYSLFEWLWYVTIYNTILEYIYRYICIYIYIYTHTQSKFNWDMQVLNWSWGLYKKGQIQHSKVDGKDNSVVSTRSPFKHESVSRGSQWLCPEMNNHNPSKLENHFSEIYESTLTMIYWTDFWIWILATAKKIEYRKVRYNSKTRSNRYWSSISIFPVFNYLSIYLSIYLSN